MKDALTYRQSGEGDLEFSKAVNRAKKWINLNIDGPLKLTFSISLKAMAGEGESVQEVQATESMFNGKKRQKKEKEVEAE